jgi:hypothetical protein
MGGAGAPHRAATHDFDIFAMPKISGLRRLRPGLAILGGRAFHGGRVARLSRRHGRGLGRIESRVDFGDGDGVAGVVPESEVRGGVEENHGAGLSVGRRVEGSGRGLGSGRVSRLPILYMGNRPH